MIRAKQLEAGNVCAWVWAGILRLIDMVSCATITRINRSKFEVGKYIKKWNFCNYKFTLFIVLKHEKVKEKKVKLFQQIHIDSFLLNGNNIRIHPD